MRILHVTDTHLGHRLYVRGAPAGYKRATDHLSAFRTALEPAMREEVDLVVHSGDLFDRSRPPAEAVAAAATLLKEVARRVPVVLVPGNHDRRGLRRHLPCGAPGLHVTDRRERLVVRGVALALVRFQRLAADWALAAREAVGPGADLLVAHQAFDGATVPGLTFRAGRQRDTIGEAELPAGIDLVMCGHIHPRQVIRVGRATVVHPGSTERTSFSERDETKGYAVWELGRDVRWRFVDLPARPMAWVTAPEDVLRVAPGVLVRVPATTGAEGAELEQAARLRGGWVCGPPQWAPLAALERGEAFVRPDSTPPGQLSLFASREIFASRGLFAS